MAIKTKESTAKSANNPKVEKEIKPKAIKPKAIQAQARKMGRCPDGQKRNRVTGDCE